MEINFFAPVELTRAALPHLRAQKGGHILNLTSVGGIIPVGGFSAYCASKYALEGWTEALRDEMAPFGVRVTLVGSGPRPSRRRAMRRCRNLRRRRNRRGIAIRSC